MEKIFDKPISEMFDPSYYHIHDVAFDQYSNMILISIGDGVNRQIHYSYDFGETWQNVFDETVYGKDNVAPIHPTSILVFQMGLPLEVMNCQKVYLGGKDLKTLKT